MPRPAMRRPARRLRSAVGTTLLVAASVMLLSGCSPTGADPAPSASDPAQSGSPAASDPAASPEPTETVEPPTPFVIACDALVTPDQLYAFNPNVGAAPDYTPQASTVVTLTTDAAGTACGYLNQTSGDVIEVAVATPSDSALESFANDAAASSTAVPTYGTPPEVTGFFKHSGSHGQAQVFTGGYWIVVDSTEFFEPGDAQRLVDDVIANLPAS